ncbi:MAG: hypothetical protein ACJ8EL_03110 [Rhizomicrobium sp.]|jgi:hypothetical protein
MGRLVFQAIEFGRDTSWSLGRQYRLWFTPSGNLQVWNTVDSRVVWHSATSGHRLAMQADGNFVIYGDRGESMWSSGTGGNGGAYLAAQDDGDLVIHSKTTDRILWRTRTAGR